MPQAFDIIYFFLFVAMAYAADIAICRSQRCIGPGDACLSSAFWYSLPFINVIDICHQLIVAYTVYLRTLFIMMPAIIADYEVAGATDLRPWLMEIRRLSHAPIYHCRLRDIIGHDAAWLRVLRRFRRVMTPLDMAAAITFAYFSFIKKFHAFRLIVSFMFDNIKRASPDIYMSFGFIYASLLSLIIYT